MCNAWALCCHLFTKLNLFPTTSSFSQVMYQVHHVHMSDILIFVFWKMIDSYQDAQLLYSIFKAKQCRWKIALQDAQAGLQQAQKKFKCARKRLTKAEFRLGRTRNTWSKIVAFPMFFRKRLAVWDFDLPLRYMVCMFLPAILNPSHNRCPSENRLIAIPGAHFAVNLNWYNLHMFVTCK